MTEARLVGALRRQRAATLLRLAGLGADTWTVECLPRRAVADVAVHLAAVDAALVGTGPGRPRLRPRPGLRALARWDDHGPAPFADPAAAVVALERSGEQLARAATLPAPLLRVPVPSPFGRQPARFALLRRLLDEWLHELDLAGVDGGPPPALDDALGRLLAHAVLAVAPVEVLPRLELRAGVVRLVIDPTWEVGAAAQPGRVTWSVDCARRQFGPRVIARPDAVVRLSAGTFAELAEGRRSWRDARPGTLVVEGCEELAQAVLQAWTPAAWMEAR